MEKREKIVVIVGPTASGKTALSLEIAKKFNGEIISADSRQIYRGLDIGTGKVTSEEMVGIPHHLLDIKNPEEIYSVADFKVDADTAIADIRSRGRLPIVVGGTFLYVEALTGGDTIPRVPPNPSLRAELEVRDADSLFHELNVKDPDRAASIDGKNKRRLVRALEIVEGLGKVPSRVRHISPYDVLSIGITLSKEELRERIEKRLNLRLEAGMIEEAKRLHTDGLSYERMEALGLEYKYLAYFLQEKMTRAAMQEKLTTEIWRYAKRQLMWLKRMKEVQWHTPTEREGIEKDITEFLTQ